MGINKKIFKAYDIRGIYPREINEEAISQIGCALAIFLKAKQILVGRDMRLSSDDLFKALSESIIKQGVDVIDIGKVSSDSLYFASGKLNLPGIMITASHLESQYNGLKICQKDAIPVGEINGLPEIAELSNNCLSANREKSLGKIIKKDILNDYVEHALSFINISHLKELKIVVDAGNGMAGKIIPLVFEKIPCTIIPLYFELDGSFPNHLANPIEKKNLAELQKKVLSEKADFGMAFDGDGDRVFFIDEKAQTISSSLIMSLIAKEILEKESGQKIIYNAVCSHIVPETIKDYGGIPLRERVGHSFIKKRMKETDAFFAGEHSGHYYFRDNFRADSGLIASLFIISVFSKQDKKFSEMIKPFRKYYNIEETNFSVEDKGKILEKIEKEYQDGKISHLDGLTIEYANWWFNLRPSNTESLIRLNLEADDEKIGKEKTDEISQLIQNR